jgi:hypothetical protein
LFAEGDVLPAILGNADRAATLTTFSQDPAQKKAGLAIC